MAFGGVETARAMANEVLSATAITTMGASYSLILIAT